MKIFGLDAEWTPNHELVVAYAYDIEQDAYYEITPKGVRIVGNHPEIEVEGGRYHQNLVLEGRAFYFAAYDDAELTKPFITFTEGYMDANLLVAVNLNKSTHMEKRSKRLADIAFDLGMPMHHLLKKDILANICDATHDVKVHCQEDARTVARVAAHFYRKTPEKYLNIVTRMQTYAEPWQKLVRTPIYVDTDYLNTFTNTDKLISTAKKFDIKMYTLGKDGKIHQNLKETQRWLEANNMSYTVTSRAKGYSKDGLQQKWSKNIMKAYIDPEDTSNKFLWLVTGAKDKLMDDTLRQQTHIIYLLALKRDSQRSFEHIHYHTEQLCAQDSGRFSPRNSPLAQGSIMRAAVIPPEGYFVASFDIQAQEPHLCAEFSGDLVLQEDLTQDLYSGVYAAYCGQPYRKLNKSVPEEAKVRNIAKSGITLPYFYGVGAETMAASLGMAPQPSQALIARLHERYSTFELFRETMCRRAVSLGHITDMYHGWPLQVDWTQNKKQTFNHVIQGSGASMLREWVVDLLGDGHKVFHTMHDGIYIYLPEDDLTANGGSATMEYIRERSMELMNKRFPLSWKDWNVEAVNFYRGQKDNPHGRLYEKGDYKDIETLIGGTA